MVTSISIAEIVRIIRAIEHQKGKHMKQTLLLLEQDNNLDAQTRKIVLDGFNNFFRSIQRELGYIVES